MESKGTQMDSTETVPNPSSSEPGSPLLLGYDVRIILYLLSTKILTPFLIYVWVHLLFLEINLRKFWMKKKLHKVYE